MPKTGVYSEVEDPTTIKPERFIMLKKNDF